MKVSLFSSCAALAAVAAAATLSSRAEAFDTGRTYEVYMLNAYQKIDTGTLHAAPFEYVGDDNAEACSYVALWDAPLGAPSPIQLFFDERITPGHADCEINS